MKNTQLAPWREVWVGVETTEALIARCGDMRVAQQVATVLARMPQRPRRRMLALFRVTPRLLGFTEAPRTEPLVRWARKRGFKLCPPEAVIAVRATYTDQACGECLSLITEAVPNSACFANVLCIDHIACGLSLYVGYASPTHLWPLDTELLFCA